MHNAETAADDADEDLPPQFALENNGTVAGQPKRTPKGAWLSESEHCTNDQHKAESESVSMKPDKL